jgi:N-acetylglucosaminyl-diphospho-decaprenol L-rhamnosyltransferase
MHVTIVTVTYRAEAFISVYLRSLDALLRSCPCFRAVIVDNCSPDKTLSVIDAHVGSSPYSDRIKIIRCQSNLGFGSGCNLGASSDRDADYYWFLNPDTSFSADSANALLDRLSQAPSLAACGSVLSGPDNHYLSGAFRFPKAATVFLNQAGIGYLSKLFYGSQLVYPLPAADHEVDWLSGASFLIRRDAFWAVQGFNEAYFLYFEEVDLFLRLNRAGFKFGTCKDSVVFHDAGASTGVGRAELVDVIPRLPRYWYDSRRYFYISNYGYLYATWVDVALISGQLLQQIKNFFLGRKTKKPRYFLSDICRYAIKRSDGSSL